MEYITEENILLLGTESGHILTHDIQKFIHFDTYNEDWPMLENGEYGDENFDDSDHEDTANSNINEALNALIKQ